MRAQSPTPFPENLMKSSFMRPALALALALSLAACGGKASFAVNGNVVGLKYSGLVLTTNGMDLTVAPAATTFSFPNSLSYGETYNLQVKAQPQHQFCQALNASATGPATDTAGRMATINLNVSCTTNAFNLGGTVSGLTADGLVLTNGSTGGTITVNKANPAYAFAAQVAYGTSYGVSVLTQPAGLRCSVGAAASGVMGDAAVGNVDITCVPAP
jgi:hypothetical protein